MSQQTQLVEQFFDGLNRHDHAAMAQCYHARAVFHDIAFDLEGKQEIVAMWRMVCQGDIRVTFEIVHVDATTAVATSLDEYTFSETGRTVRNAIRSRFRFRDGVIIEHIDECDPKAWGAMAMGGPFGFVAGRVGWIRRRKARAKLRPYLAAQMDDLSL